MAREEPWLSTSSPPSDFNIHVHGVTFNLNKKCMISRSAKLAMLLEPRQHHTRTYSFTDIPADAETFELVARFCYGYEPELSPETVIPLFCVASYLEMTEEHSPDNLLKKAFSFFSTRVLPCWNETVRAFKTVEPVLSHAKRLGLVEACLDSITDKALADPLLLENPVDPSAVWHDDPSSSRVVGAKRRLFLVDWHAEDLTSLTLDLFVSAMSAVAGSGVPPDHVARCLYRYAKKKAGVGSSKAVAPLLYEKSDQRLVIEAVERLLPDEKGTMHITCLFELLHSAIFLQASRDCRNRLEARIGKRLAEASVDDLFIPCYDYTSETTHDVECVKRVLIHFCSNFYTSPDISELAAVSSLVQDFLARVARDADLKMEMFGALLEILAGMLKPIGRCSDGVYRAIDVYLDTHGHMTESEREEICKVLDCRGLSLEASEHAAQNERLPLRVVAQVLFIGQLQIREAITGALRDADGALPREEQEELNKEGKGLVVSSSHGGEEEEEEEEEERRMEMVMMERNCGRGTKREIGKCGGCGGFGVVKKSKMGFWKEVKAKLGCKGGLYECNCHGKKVHPRINGG